MSLPTDVECSVSADPLLGRVVAGRYRVTRTIGRGGSGAIYEVMHERLNRSFALKRLAAPLALQPEAVARFRREADVVARLRHPNIVEIVDWETLDDGSPCMILEHLAGRDLARRLSEGGPLTWPELMPIADAVLSALSAAHRAGIVHRDLKPANIFLAEDDSGETRVKLLDFGISKILDSARVTGDRDLLGTPLYMSPEQARNLVDEIGPATDVWAMGTILYEMATGQAAFGAENTPAVLYRICHGVPQPLVELRADASPPFVAAVTSALVRGEGRVKTVDELRARLRAATPTSAPPEARSVSASSQSSRYKIALSLAVAAMLAVVAVVAWAVHRASLPTTAKASASEPAAAAAPPPVAAVPKANPEPAAALPERTAAPPLSRPRRPRISAAPEERRPPAQPVDAPPVAPTPPTILLDP